MTMGTTRDWRPAFEQQTARINVDDNTWRKFRRLCLDRGEHISEVLGRLVTNELDRHHRPATDPAPRAQPPTRERDDTTAALSLFD